MVTDQKGHGSRHESGGSDEIALDGLTLSDDSQLNIGTDSDFVFSFDSGNSRFELVDNVNDSDILRLTNSGSFDIVNRNLDMGGGKVENVDTVDGVTVDSHSSRHENGGADELDAADLSGSSGSDGQVLQTDGSAASWVDFQSGSDVSDDGSLVVEAPSDVNFGNQLDVSDDGDGSVTVDANVSTESTTTVSSDYTTQGETTIFCDIGFDFGSAELEQSNSFSGIYPEAVSDIHFNGDGTKLFITDSYDEIVVYYLSSSYDITSVSNSFRYSFSISGLEALDFNDDGTKIYMTGYEQSEVVEYELSTAYDLSSASQSGTFDTGVLAQGTIQWVDDGSYFYITERSGDIVERYDASTPYDLSSLSSTPSIDTTWDENGESQFYFTEDGNHVYVSGSSTIYDYDLTTAYDITTATYTNNSIDVGEGGDDIAIHREGTVIFTNDGDTTVKKFDAGKLGPITLSSADVSDGKIARVIDISGNAKDNNLIIDTEGDESINGQPSAVINSSYESLTLQSDGTDWFIVNRFSGGGL